MSQTKFFKKMLKEQHTYIVAELSANHNSSIERAEAIIKAAADAGADAIKLQTYTADSLTIPSSQPYFKIEGTSCWAGRTFYDLYEEAYMPWDWHQHLKTLANNLGLDCFSTPFDNTAVDFLMDVGVPCFKVASFEVIDIPLLKKIASTKMPVIMSTGMATLSEIHEAVSTLQEGGCPEIVLLKCTSAYPALPEEANLLTIPNLAQTFNCPVGLSDHTLGSAVAVAAVSLGAKVIEKHVTLSRADGGPDSSFSMEPHEFKQLVQDVRVVEKALGHVNYELTEKEKESVAVRRSLFVVKDMKRGDVFTSENVRSIRPGNGLHPRYLETVIGRKASADLEMGTPVSWDILH